LLRTAECAARASTIDDLADAVVAGVADILGASRCTLLKAAPELLMPLGTADRGPLLDAELQVAGAVMRTQEPESPSTVPCRGMVVAARVAGMPRRMRSFGATVTSNRRPYASKLMCSLAPTPFRVATSTAS